MLLLLIGWMLVGFFFLVDFLFSGGGGRLYSLIDPIELLPTSFSLPNCSRTHTLR
jgi:hypothetical protein